MTETIIRMYSGDVYYIEETYDEVVGLIENLERGDHGFVSLRGALAPRGGLARLPRPLSLKVNRIESMGPR